MGNRHSILTGPPTTRQTTIKARRGKFSSAIGNEVFGVRGCSRGMSVPRGNGVLLSRLPQPVQGSSEITDLYLNKFGQPHPGSRIFLWTRQAINGRKDALKRTSAIVPPLEK